MSKQRKKSKQTKYLSAKNLGILDSERKALIAFAKNKTEGRVINYDSKTHYYRQDMVDLPNQAYECDTGGCIAGFVFHHVIKVQHKRRLRGRRTVDGYYSIMSDLHYISPQTMLGKLYTYTKKEVPLKRARKVVLRMLTKGEVDWYAR